MNFAFLVHPLSSAMLRLFGWRTGQIHLAVGSSARLQREGVQPANIRVITTLPEIRSATGAVCTGRIIGLPALPEVLIERQDEAVRLMATAAMQYGVGCELIGLGAVCAIVGLRGQALAERIPKPVTTGNALTCWTSAETVCRLYDALRHAPRFHPRVLLVGFPGTMAESLLAVLARRGLPVEVWHESFPRRLERSIEAVEQACGVRIRRHRELDRALQERGIVVGAGSLGGELVGAALRSGTVVVDVAQPLDTSPAQRAREDLIVVEGELIAMPEASGSRWRGALTGAYNAVVGQGDDRVFACLAEPMVLALEGRAESFSLGRSIDPARVEVIGALARRHGFGVRGLYTGRKELTPHRLAEFIAVPWL